MRWLVLSLLLLTACCKQIIPQPNEQALLADMRGRVSLVTVSCLGIRFGTGTAIDLGDGYFVTANHVAKYGCNLVVLDSEAEVVYRDATHDLAILKHPNISSPTLLLNSKPYLGQKVICVNWSAQVYTQKAELQVTRGEVIIDFGDKVRVGCSYESGGSGGAVFDETGALVGVSVSIVRELNDEYYAIPSRWLVGWKSH